VEQGALALLRLMPEYGPLGIGWIAWLLQLRENSKLRAELHRYTAITLQIVAQDKAAVSLLGS